MNLPLPSPLPGNDNNISYVFLGDGAFALSTHIMKPFPGHYPLGSPERIFNQELSRSQDLSKTHTPRTHESLNCFNDLLYVHIFLKNSNSSRDNYTPPGSFDTYNANGELIRPGSWRNNTDNAFLPLLTVPRIATDIRLDFMNYFYRNGR